ncbi:MAG: peptide-methionine (R)-S-oxide reductase MsrB [Hydrotalea flava]|nr:peptide-methionine (R)-S-oxide reductase MsrB [Hydrotalea flava]RWZ87417.1 MAG: peptide-methionine (R)-S-oxide reductase [Hydrotalea sp. AMD]NIM36196.1 peptide-methionine (R)-S-oxide reductase MsrB [Hydrotalea flava]NIM39047.1 peptide-methionine (R)-S-oxide reductase MsrB [Hydrotalea flava]NIN04282.1 peptide-methionine (R)-S-oxide reductase MsrB [Hydrotalea flava]
MKLNLFSITLFLLMNSCYSQPQTKTTVMENNSKNEFSKTGADAGAAIVKTDAEWKELLSPEVYYVAREKGTERPFTSKFETFKEVGTYYCAVCGNALFKSDTKFDSGCGWPSFYEPISKNSVIYLPDNSYGMKRTEVECGRCKSHLGHVFEDGPPPTGLRYCINGVVLDFKKAQEAEKKYNENH